MSLVLLDRDGVLVEDRPDYVKHPGELKPIAGAGAALARLNRAGHHVVVCTNQSAVGRGIINLDMLERIHQHLRELMWREGGQLDAILFCPDPPWAAGPRRKPSPGMLREALAQFRADPSATPFVGDNLPDLQAALAAGCRRVLVRTGYGAKVQAAGLAPELAPVAVYADLPAFVDAFLGPSRDSDEPAA